MRKKLATKICAIAMTAAMVASLAACGNNDPGSSSEGGNSGGNSGAGNASGSGASGGNESGGSEGESGSDNTLVKDLGGVTIRVNDGIWSNLDPDKEGTPEYIAAWDKAEILQKRYNVKFEYVKLQIDDGYSRDSAIQQTILGGECFADLFAADDQVTIGLIDYLAEVPNPDKLEWGSRYLEPATWNGKLYGFSYDNIGSPYVMVYSREYLEKVAGMDVTPTEKFLKGEWDYGAFQQYLTDLKAKLPADTYPIAIHPYHWASMAPGANGVVSVDSNMDIHLTDEAYIDAMTLYQDLVRLGLAAPLGAYEVREGGGIASGEEPYGVGGMCTATESKNYVITMVEAWQMSDLYTNLSGEWGIVPWPWSSKYVSCEGDYTTLGSNYLAVQSIWTNMVAPKQEYRGKDNAATISDEDLFMVARDWCDLASENAAAVRHAAWEAEKNGTEYVNMGFDPGKIGSFSTTEDAALYDWLHTRAAIDWGHSMQNNGIVRVNRNAVYVLTANYDARSAGQTWQEDGETNLGDRWPK